MVRHRQGVQTFLPIERDAQAAGFRWVAGIDEAGCGPLAGPVVAAAVVLPWDTSCPGLRDSKCLTPRQREIVYDDIVQQALAYGLGVVSHAEIDQHNIRWATKQAMLKAIWHIQPFPDLLLIDGVTSLPTPLTQRLLVRGDARCASIAAASILAKVTRDRLMRTYAQEYPLYGFEHHKGYPTTAHYARLRQHGPCAIHRRSFRGVLPPGGEDA